MAKIKYVSTGAKMYEGYRYLLWREWRGTPNAKWKWFGFKDGAGVDCGEPKTVLFIMLNPSTADAEKDDPTIRRCVNFARSWGYDRMEVANLFAYRATKPQELFKLSGSGDPIGPYNQEYVTEAANDADRIVCAWGNHGAYIDQGETVRGWLEGRTLYTFGLTGARQPIHPLYVPADTKLKVLR